MVLIHASCITGRGGWSIPGVELFVFVPLAALVVAIGALPCLLVRSIRSTALGTLFYSAGMVALFIPALGLASKARHYGFALAARRAEPLVVAIARYAREHGQPPETLSTLIPTYLSHLPSGVPDVKLISGEAARTRFAGNSWVLQALVPSGIINFDQFMYFPNQQYPEFGYGGGVERIADWAYVHE